MLVVPSSLCILRLSAIGDVCHAVSMVSRIRAQSPNTTITWIIGKIEYQLVQHIPDIEFIVFDKSKGKAAYKALEEELKGRQFDVLLAMQVAFRANLVAARISAKKKIGYDWARSKELHWLFTNARIKAQTHAHVLDSFMAFADAANIPAQTHLEWQIPISQEVEQWVAEKTEGFGRYAVINPAASKQERNWLPERYAKIAEYLSSKGLTPILCGGPSAVDKQLGEKIISQTTCISGNFIGQTTLLHMLAMLRKAELVIAPDTGPAHMATMVGTPVIGLYAHSNPRRTGPYLSQNYVVNAYDDLVVEKYGKQWSELPWGTRVKGENLMQRITIEQVRARIDQVVNECDIASECK
ncbi:glycosyltransferase family 9 protein [Aestuariibacter sp. AA17]|uniref:Glycosyltransferase family 9 protein n=1 Tax=Fluctibacter corallii TaxID=2984329 RepID=A0ABT3ABU7_9ALTE|nr:glycosyltransferase family 9 protein [Aestuariibacter sp. AA17]MCV2886163.1 glycosyltransferase family 9 protein [Aestuariibacter sp. AA17]